MKVILYMAMSINGIIARTDNKEDFLSHYNWQTLCKLVKKHRSFIWGRKTYELVQNWQNWGEDYQTTEIKNAYKVVISTNKKLNLKTGYFLANSLQKALKMLSDKGFKSTILTGGSTINSAFAKQKLINEIIINVEPVVIGRGITLFKNLDADFKLKLLSFNRVFKDIVQYHYKVL